mgnify:CR=1 FL=1
MSVRVVAPCRLHFGLFHVPVDGLTHYPDGRPVRKFGGLGMMIDNPCVTVTVSRSTDWVAIGPYSTRAIPLAKRVNQRVAALSEANSTDTDFPASLTTTGPPEHTGFGVGTSLGMAVARILSQLVDFPDVWVAEPMEMAGWVGRGQRSGIGIHGFVGGGFIVDDGKLEDELPRLGVRLDFPEWWRIVLVRPPTPPAWFGDRERIAFTRTRPADKALSLTDRLRTLAYDTIVPAVRDADFDTFARSIFEFNRLAGEPFHDDQGGPYAGAEVACVIDELIEMGAVGLGQSSWGPTVFAMCRDADEAERLAAKARARFSSATEVTVTAANNTGARIETL